MDRTLKILAWFAPALLFIYNLPTQLNYQQNFRDGRLHSDSLNMHIPRNLEILPRLTNAIWCMNQEKINQVYFRDVRGNPHGQKELHTEFLLLF